MKIVRLEIEDDSILSGIDAVALVEKPAIEETFFAFSAEKFAETYSDYPEAAVEAAKQGIKRNEAIDNACATQVGKVRAQQLANREPLSLDTVRRMRAFLIRQKDNYELARSRKDYNACGYISYLLWGGEAALPWAEKILRQAGEEFAEIGPRGGVKESPKAPKSDTPNPSPKGEGTARGEAGTTRGAEVDAATEESLKKKADEFNEKYKDKLGYGANVGALKSVYQRGLGAYNTSRSPAVAARGGAKQWAMARVNAFLYLLKEGRPQNRNYTTDYDLLPKDHPKRKDFNQIFETMILNKIIESRIYNDKFSIAGAGAPLPLPQELLIPFAQEKVSIDYHEVLTTERGKELARRLITEGYDVHVISAGEDKTPFAETLAEIGIPMSKAHAVGSNKKKIELIKELGITKHYDNSQDVINELGEIGVKFELVVSGLPNYVNEPTGKLTVNKEASYGFAALEDKQMLIGPLMTPGKLILRKDEFGDPYYVYFTEDTIQQIAYKAMEDKIIDRINIEHDSANLVDDIFLAETWLVENPAKDKSVDYGFSPIKGQWFGIYKVNNDEIWKDYIKTGKVKGFSVEGFFSEKLIK